MDTIDLKTLGHALQEAGLMQKSFAAMSADEVREVAGLIRACEKKRCVFCEQWQRVENAPWWVGKCKVTGCDVSDKSFCNLAFDQVPF